MTSLEILLSVAFGVQFIASVSLAMVLHTHDRKLNILGGVVQEMGMYLATQVMKDRKREEKKYGKSKSETR
jgi:hypothetical protein